MRSMKNLFFGKTQQGIDMTRGSVVLQLVRFSIPLLLGSLFQQLYNTVDAWVVGNYVSKEAYSAVGSVAQPIAMLIGVFTGLSSGATVLISQYFGARNEDAVKRTVGTAIGLTAILGIVLTAIGVAIVPIVIDWMKVPSDVRLEAIRYLAIYLSGLLGMFLYNIGAAILRAVGDSLHAFIYLLVATGLNIGLDLLFVLEFGMGVEGVAWATVIAQAAAAFFVLLHLKLEF